MTANPYTEHRQEHWEFIEANGVPVRRDSLMRLLDEWRSYNMQWFGTAMIEPYVLLTPPSGSRLFGDTSSVGSFGEPLEIRLRPSLLDGTHPKVNGPAEGCFRFVADVLLHETIHQWQMEVIRNFERAYHGHGPQFTAKCNEIGQALGLPPVVTRNRKGSKLPRSAQWPHNVRPPDYYLGAYDPDGGVPDPGEDDPVPGPEMTVCPRCSGTGQIPAVPSDRDS
jgi:hypothetical protein